MLLASFAFGANEAKDQTMLTLAKELAERSRAEQSVGAKNSLPKIMKWEMFLYSAEWQFFKELYWN